MDNRKYTFRSDTFNGLTRQLDRFIDEDDRYMKVSCITAKRVDVKLAGYHDYYWEGIVEFTTDYQPRTINTDYMNHAV